MARRTPDAKLETRESRSRLASRGKPHYRLLEPGLHIGYRRLKGRKGRPGVAGTWVARHYVGGRSYVVERLGVADDFADADGTKILSFAQAQDKARMHMVRRAHTANGVAGPLTVQAAVESYLEFLETNRKSAVDTRHRALAHIYPTLGNVEVATLSTEVLRKWQAGLVKAFPRARTKPGKAQQHRVFDGSEEAVRRRRSSANRVLTILKAALNHAFHDGKVASDAAWRKVKPFHGVDAARVRYLTVAEAKRLINAADPEFRPLVQAALQTGCRYGELTRLEVADFNADSGTLAVRQSKSGKPRHVVLTDEGVAFFTQLAARPKRRRAVAAPGKRRSLEGLAPRPPHGRRLRAREDHARDLIPRFAAHLGLACGHGRRAIVDRGEKLGSQRYAHGGEALRSLGTELHRGCDPGRSSEVRV